jgi:hypothetical protein
MLLHKIICGYLCRVPSGLTRALLVLICAAELLGLGSIAPAMAQAKLDTISKSKIPEPPGAVGCFTYIRGRWKRVACLTPEELRRVPRPNIGGAFGSLGIGSPLTSALSSAISGGFVSVQGAASFPTDSKTGKNAFSVQLNTNGFNALCNSSNPLPPGFAATFLNSRLRSPCVNKDTAALQFTYQTAKYGISHDLICIWNVDVTKQYYYSPGTWQACTDVGKAGFWPASSVLTISGQVNATNHQITLIAGLPWSTEWQSVVTPDWFGLCWSRGALPGTQCPWRQISGTVYGLGNGSTANFPANSTVTTVLKSQTFVAPNTGTSITAGGTSGGVSTKESNNLTQWLFAPPITTCAGVNCQMTYSASFP